MDEGPRNTVSHVGSTAASSAVSSRLAKLPRDAPAALPCEAPGHDDPV